MPLDPEQPRQEKSSALKVVVHSFFVVPLIIAGFAVIVFLMVRILTEEPRTAHDYLMDVKIGGTTKRWQGAFELSKILGNPALVPKDPRFEQELISAFEHSQHDRDSRVRQYLALAMGQAGNAAYIPSLLEALQDKEEAVVASAAKGLGMTGSAEATEALMSLMDHGSPQVRLQAVIALGIIGDGSATPVLEKALEDPEPNVRWDAAIALAKWGNPAGRRILLDLLDRSYLDSYPNIDAVEQDQAILVAVNAAERIMDSDIRTSLKHLQQTDRNMRIREAARRVLEKTNTETSDGRNR